MDKFAENQKMVVLRNKGEYTDFEKKIENVYEECRDSIISMIREARGNIIFLRQQEGHITSDEGFGIDFSRITFNHEGILVFSPKQERWYTISNKKNWVYIYDMIMKFGEEYASLDEIELMTSVKPVVVTCTISAVFNPPSKFLDDINYLQSLFDRGLAKLILCNSEIAMTDWRSGKASLSYLDEDTIYIQQGFSFTTNYGNVYNRSEEWWENTFHIEYNFERDGDVFAQITYEIERNSGEYALECYDFDEP